MIKFDKETHTYSVGGAVLPSVTQVLKGMGIINTKFYTEDSRDRGTKVHDALEMLDLDMVEKSFIEPDIEGYIRAYEQFKYDVGAKVLEVEKIVTHEELWYAGTLDRIMDIGGKRVIVDIKTGSHEDWHNIQLSAYKLALGEKDIAMANLYLTKRGKCNMTWCGDKMYSVVFVAAINLWRYINGQRTNYPGDDESAKRES